MKVFYATLAVLLISSTVICSRQDVLLQNLAEEAERLRNSSLIITNLTLALQQENERTQSNCERNLTADSKLLEDIRKLVYNTQSINTNTTITTITTTTTTQPTPQMPSSCAEAVLNSNESGAYQLYVPGSGLPAFKVYCLTDPNNGAAWTLLQRRQNGLEDFDRDWQEYKNGFGNLTGDHWLGLDKIHALTHAQNNELWIQLEDSEGSQRNAKYTDFKIGNETENYALNVLGEFNGNVSDALRQHHGKQFSTKDVDNDFNRATNCAELLTGGWWFFADEYRLCGDCNLNGRYLSGGVEKFEDVLQNIFWMGFVGFQDSTKYEHMAIRQNLYSK